MIVLVEIWMMSYFIVVYLGKMNFQEMMKDLDYCKFFMMNELQSFFQLEFLILIVFLCIMLREKKMQVVEIVGSCKI